MSRKQINVVVEDTCEDCPYCDYNSHYDMSYDSGYDCSHDDCDQLRIANDGYIDQHQTAMKKWAKSQKTLYPMDRDDVPNDPMMIPDWCPLEDVKENKSVNE